MKINKIAIIVMMALICQIGYGQVTIDDNVPALGNYVGFDNFSTIDLPIENNGVRTLYSFEDWPGYNNRPAISNANRIFMPIEPGITQPNIFSLLQIGWDLDVALQREWMNAGITIGADGNDLMWTGIIPDPDNDDSQAGGDAAIVWGDNISPAAFGPDNLRFIFINDLTTATDGPSSDQGRETMRITPGGNVGIGDRFNNDRIPHRRLTVHRAGILPQFRIAHSIDNNVLIGRHADFQIDNSGHLFIRPSEADTVRGVAIGFLDGQQSDPTSDTRLDVGGLTRVRSLPDSVGSCVIIGFNASSDSADHYLHRLDFTGNSDEYLAGDGTWQTGGPGGLDCRWEDVNSLTVTNETDLRTGFSTQDGCYRGKVVIGEEVAKNGKLESHNLYDRDSVSTAIWAESRQIDGQTTDNYATGIFGRAQGLQTGTELSMIFVGVEGIGGVSQPGRFNIGVRGTGQSDSEATLNFGGYFQATGPGSNNIGVYCEATDTSGLAAYFAGPTASGTPIALTSDASVKTNIESISEASQILSQLQPRSYNYIPIESRPGLFDESLQYGFIAQEMQEVLPELVKDVSLPALLDSSGVIEGTELELLGIQYTELIPILVAGFQEQNAEMTAVMEENQSLQAQVAEQANQIQALQEQMSNVMTSLQASQSKMNNCCGTPQEKKQSESGMIELEQNFPNPFNDVTTINYSTSYPAQIRLDISDSQGRVLEVLVNQRQDAGEYRVQWDASEFAPGTYYYSLYADTELLTKKMIKK